MKTNKNGNACGVSQSEALEDAVLGERAQAILNSNEFLRGKEAQMALQELIAEKTSDHPFLPQETVSRFIENEDKIIAEILTGREDMLNGRTVAHEEVMRKGADIIDKTH